MNLTHQEIKSHDLLVRIAEVASILGEAGQQFNRHLIQQFEGWETLNLKEVCDTDEIPGEHLLFYRAVAQTLGWIQQIPIQYEWNSNDLKDRPSPLPIIYLRVLVEARSGLNKKVDQRLEEMLEEQQEKATVKKPRRLMGVIAGLETWSRVVLPDVGDKGALDLEEIQRLALDAGGRARWTALAPLKMYALCKGLGTTTPRSIYPPMGRAVSRGIERLLGFALGESEGDYKISRELHLKLADLAGISIWDINSGFYRLGGGS